MMAVAYFRSHWGPQFYPLSIILITFLYKPCLSDLPACTVLDQCSCKVESTGQIISLQDLDDRNGPRFKNVKDEVKDNYHYFYSPCTPISYKDYKNVLIYQTADSGAYFNLGDVKLTVDATHENYQFIYVGKNKDGQDRTTVLNLVCPSQTSKDDATGPTLPYFLEGPQYKYTGDLTSKCACNGGCSYDPNYFNKKSSAGSKKLSVGSILCIVLLVSIVMYLVVGIIINKYAMNKTGINTVPNWTFWKDFPILVKDGVSFIITYLKEDLCSRAQYSQI